MGQNMGNMEIWDNSRKKWDKIWEIWKYRTILGNIGHDMGNMGHS